ncbi:MAG TPA: SHOCT domain-containing protein [Thermodesulfobacteriota bacterium]|nr:SHOCT domain-containing protein [Thermodesulfobacteriota bacterium]
MPWDWSQGEWLFGVGGMLFMMGVAALLWLALLAATVAVVVWVARVVWERAGAVRRPERGAAGETPLEILKRRYAAGELSPEEFERMKRHLAEP